MTCQHGEAECQANKFEACVIHYLPSALPFVHCLELQLAQQKALEKAARKCYSTFRLSPHLVDQIT